MIAGFDPGSRDRAGSKITARLLGWLRIRWFDTITETSELPNHSCSAPLLGLFGGGWAPFFVTNSLVQYQPDQSTLSMSNGPDGLVVS